jgi:hydroxymethylpyrimidine/phosphomethylpyrimidine kinase
MTSMPFAAPATPPSTRPVVLSIAGSDSGGGAGIQADLRVFSRLGTFGTTVITATTAQNLSAVSDVHVVTVDNIRAQIAAVLGGFTVRAVKTGMLFSAAVVEAVAETRRQSTIGFWVVDPVMVATSGALLAQPEAVRAYREKLLPGATLVTPNLDEAAVFLGVTRIGRDQMPKAAQELTRLLGCAVLLKGGHLDGDPLDLLVAAGVTKSWTRPRLDNVNTHGTGCMLSAAIAAHLARGFSLPDACDRALAFVASALARPWLLEGGHRLSGIEAAESQ